MSHLAAGLLTLGLRHVLGWILLASAADKFLHLRAFREILARYPIVARVLVRPAALLVPLLETALALALLTGMYWREAAVATGVLISLFSVAIVAAMRRGLTHDCGCGGVLASESIGLNHLAINALLVGVAAILAASDVTSMTMEAGPVRHGLPYSVTSWDETAPLVALYAAAFVLSLAVVRAVSEMRTKRRSLDSLRGVHNRG